MCASSKIRPPRCETGSPIRSSSRLNSRHLFAGFRADEPPADIEARFQALCNNLADCWQTAREELGCQVIQQTALPVFPQLFGNNEHRLPGSPAALVHRFNERVRELADAQGVHILSLEAAAQADGLDAWHDPVLWHRAKQEIHPAASPVYGDLVGRLLAALQGRSRKCLVLDLDNTLWGGVIGDDGLDGIVLGQGSALGEAFVAFQQYARDLTRRGVILAVCSKNEEANALEPFDKHPEMVLKRNDIACFAASWRDKATALRNIAEQLNIGIDSLVFADDNPFERALVHRELPMVAVPELPADPARYVTILARAGYFEGLQLTDEDLTRSEQYQRNLLRESLREQSTDIESYLQSLDMEMRWSRFRRIDQQRIFQLINKTNQFNLTTRRYSEEDVAAVLADDKALSLQLRLLDRFGDNGIIGLVIGRFVDASADIEVDTWLMSCRVLGRQVEEATLDLVVAAARALGAKRLIGRYRPTKKNGMVAEHYPKLGFAPLPAQGPDLLWVLDVREKAPVPTFIRAVEVLEHDAR